MIVENIEDKSFTQFGPDDYIALGTLARWLNISYGAILLRADETGFLENFRTNGHGKGWRRCIRVKNIKPFTDILSTEDAAHPQRVVYQWKINHELQHGHIIQAANSNIRLAFPKKVS